VMPGGNIVFMTVWDGGGIDTYDFSGTVLAGAPGITVDLRPGEWTVLAPAQTAVLNFQDGARPPGNIANPLLYNGDTRSLIENAIGSIGSDVIRGNEAANNLNGGGAPLDGHDELYGYGGDDTLIGDGLLFGGDGNDTVTGGSRGDSLEGNAGNDVIRGNGGDDRLYGHEGDDTLYGGDGNDGLLGGSGSNTLDGGAGNDTLEGGDQGDTLIGGADNDTLYGYDGNDAMSGGAGDDAFYVEDAGDQVVEAAGEGTDTIWSTVSIVAPANVEKLVLSDVKYGVFLTGPAINATGNALDNTITGNFQSNVIDGGAGIDTMRGNGGDDTYYVDNLGDLVYEVEGAGNDTIFSSVSYELRESPPEPPGYDPYAGSTPRPWYTGENQIETLILTGAGNLSGTGNSSGNRLQGNSGNNMLDGREGADTLLGGAGADQLIGGVGADIFLYTAAADSTGGQIDWLSDFEHGTDKIDVRALSVSQISFVVAPDNSSTRATLLITGSAALVIDIAGAATTADFLFNGAPPADNAVYGTSGPDTLDAGGRSNISLIGLAGNDIYSVFNGTEIIVEAVSEGTDRVFASVSYVLTAGAEVELLTTNNDTLTTAIDLTGNEFANAITGNAGANVLSGGGGNDSLNGGLGNDTLAGGTGNDVFYIDAAGDVVHEAVGEGMDTIVTAVSYTLAAGAEVEVLRTLTPAATTALNLTGSNTANAITGNAGANVIDGRGGNDTMVGFGGNDVY
jgi:trimeric autotransporter adhesin